MKKWIFLLMLPLAGCDAMDNFVHMAPEDEEVIPVENLKPTDITAVEYIFIDAERDPQKNRSYSIYVIPEQVKVTVDSWGDVIERKKYDYNLARFDSLMELSKKVFDINSDELSRYAGCPDCDAHRLYFYRNKDLVKRYAWAGDKAMVSLYSYAEEIKDVVPDLNKLIALPEEKEKGKKKK